MQERQRDQLRHEKMIEEERREARLVQLRHDKAIEAEREQAKILQANLIDQMKAQQALLAQLTSTTTAMRPAADGGVSSESQATNGYWGEASCRHFLEGERIG